MQSRELPDHWPGASGLNLMLKKQSWFDAEAQGAVMIQVLLEYKVLYHVNVNARCS